MTTRPPSNDPADIAAWEEEKERLREEKQFREDMRASAADTKVRLEWLAQGMQTHEKRDEERFAEQQAQHEDLAKKVRAQGASITKTTNKLSIIWAAAGIAVTVISVVWAIAKG